MMTEFTDTELIIISLVLSQNAEQYADAADADSVRNVRRISTKARKMANERNS